VELLPVWRSLGNEAAAVALAEAVQPRGFNGFNPDAFRPGATAAQAKASIDAMVAFNRRSAKAHSGVWRDLAVRKRRTEVDVQIAPIAHDPCGRAGTPGAVGRQPDEAVAMNLHFDGQVVAVSGAGMGWAGVRLEVELCPTI